MLFQEVPRLAALAEQAAAAQPALTADVTEAIRAAIAGMVDPYVLSGILVEGIVLAISDGVPDARQTNTGLAVAMLLADRLKAEGVL